MAEEEVTSLHSLVEDWRSDDIGVSWVRLYDFFPQYNAIVTDAAEGKDAFALFRKLDLRRRFGWQNDSERLCAAMTRLGTALRRFHQKNAKKIFFRLDELLPKLERYCNEIEAIIKRSYPNHVKQILNSIADINIDAVEVTTLKGIDIRNILVAKEDKLWLLDPGRMKRTCREADLARFIMTYRILYWGSSLFLLGLKPDWRAEQAFLDAYYENSTPPSPKLLSLYLIKEQLKHWWTALDSLRMLPYSPRLKKLVEVLYVNPYYIRQLKTEIQKVI